MSIIIYLAYLALPGYAWGGVTGRGVGNVNWFAPICSLNATVVVGLN